MARALFADLPHSSLRLDIDNPQRLQAIAQQLRQAIEAPPLPAVWLAELKSAYTNSKRQSLAFDPLS